MKYVILSLLTIVLLSGCGYKADPVYIEKTKEIK